MDKIRFAIVGSGWRSRFYIRIAKALPEQFEICSMLFRSEEKAQVFQKEYSIPVTVSKEEYSILMQEAIKTGKAVSSEMQVWNL